ncbi:MAG: hypothetical protein M3220_06200 [Chloroflexota bacterium]|nr:hypothetical protein [Chloroflexota bacterium]
MLQLVGGDQLLVGSESIVYLHAGNERTRHDLVEVRLLGSGFAWWLLRHGKVPLHAGALGIDGGAVLLAAESGMGKSSLMCSLVREGIPLLSDDFVAVENSPSGEIVAASAYPQMRMWPETVEHFIGNADRYPPVFDGGVKRRVAVEEPWGHFLEGIYRVSRIYLLRRWEHTNGAVQLERVSGHDVFMSLLTSILLGPSFPMAELQHVWLTLQQIVEQVPVYRLSYPTGWKWLPALHYAIVYPE